MAVPAVPLRGYYGTDAGGGQAEDSTAPIPVDFSLDEPVNASSINFDWLTVNMGSFSKCELTGLYHSNAWHGLTVINGGLKRVG